MTQQTLVDTLRVFRPDSATNAGIYYHETIKLIDRPKTNKELFIEQLSIWVPIFIAGLALYYTIRSDRKQSKNRREDKKLEYEESRLKVKPLLNFELVSTQEREILNIYNNGRTCKN